MDRIESQIRMGQERESLAQVGQLHLMLDHCISIINGMQQPPSCTESEEACKQYEDDCLEAQISIEDLAGQIYIGLTGHKVVIDPEKAASQAKMKGYEEGLKEGVEEIKRLREEKVMLHKQIHEAAERERKQEVSIADLRSRLEALEKRIVEDIEAARKDGFTKGRSSVKQSVNQIMSLRDQLEKQRVETETQLERDFQAARANLMISLENEESITEANK